MVADSELQLRDFDGESEDTDSETELLIRHSGRGQQQTKRGSIATTRYYLHDYSTNNTTQPSASTTSSLSSSFNTGSNIATGFLSNLFGNSKTTNSLGRTAGQVRFRNERSRERARYDDVNTSARIQQQEYKQNQTRTGYNFGGAAFNTGLGTSANAKLAETTQTSYRGNGGATSGVGGVSGHGVTESVALGVRSGGGGGAHKRYDATSGVTTNGGSSDSVSGGGGLGGGAGVVLQQTVLDAENGSTTVYYQKNRRRSKRRSLANLCKMCMCGRYESFSTCRLCCQKHSLRYCNAFMAMTPEERYESVRAHKYCINCLATSHVTGACDSPDSCHKCGLAHHTLLHRQQEKPPKKHKNRRSVPQPKEKPTTRRVVITKPKKKREERKDTQRRLKTLFSTAVSTLAEMQELLLPSAEQAGRHVGDMSSNLIEF